jgi:hypothetical protein
MNRNFLLALPFDPYLFYKPTELKFVQIIDVESANSKNINYNSFILFFPSNLLNSLPKTLGEAALPLEVMFDSIYLDDLVKKKEILEEQFSKNSYLNLLKIDKKFDDIISEANSKLSDLYYSIHNYHLDFNADLAIKCLKYLNICDTIHFVNFFNLTIPHKIPKYLAALLYDSSAWTSVKSGTSKCNKYLSPIVSNNSTNYTYEYRYMQSPTILEIVTLLARIDNNFYLDSPDYNLVKQFYPDEMYNLTYVNYDSPDLMINTLFLTAILQLAEQNGWKINKIKFLKKKGEIEIYDEKAFFNLVEFYNIPIEQIKLTLNPENCFNVLEFHIFANNIGYSFTFRLLFEGYRNYKYSFTISSQNIEALKYAFYIIKNSNLVNELKHSSIYKTRLLTMKQACDITGSTLDYKEKEDV